VSPVEWTSLRGSSRGYVGGNTGQWAAFIPLTVLEVYLHQTNTETEDLSSVNNSESGYSKNVGTVLEICLARLTRKSAQRVPFYVCDASGCQTKQKSLSREQ